MLILRVALHVLCERRELALLAASAGSLRRASTAAADQGGEFHWNDAAAPGFGRKPL